MAFLEIGPDDALYYDWTPPAGPGARSFLFINPITGDTGLWAGAIKPALLAAGHGVLLYDFRGQTQSRFKPGQALDADLIVADLRRMIERIAPEKPILVGLSIGGLYAARAALAGAEISGLVLINTLRRMTPRVEWMNAATMRANQVGGPNLLKDLYFHLLMGEDFQAANRSAFLVDTPDYTPLDPQSGAFNLITWMVRTSWEIDWSKLECPVLSITGLQDRVFFDPAIVDELFAGLKHARRVDFPDAGHMLPIEKPDRFVETLLAFGKEIAG